MKKVLILTAEFGKGHMSVAEHLKTALETSGKAEAKIIDFGEYASGPFTHSHKSYDTATKHIPKAYRLFFDVTNDVSALRTLGGMQLKMSERKATKLFKEEKPDLVVIAFGGWVYAASKLAKKVNPKTKVVSLATDSMIIHRSWSLGDIDAFIVPDKDTAETVVEDGLDPKLVKAIGYPVNPKLYDNSFDTAKFLSGFKFDTGKKTILLIPTLSNKDKTLHLIEKVQELNKFNLAVICGRDNELHRKLKPHQSDKNFHLVGWTDMMPEYMLASDIIITKAGGSTVQECIAGQKPLVINQVIPGQEQGNALYVEKNLLGLVALTNNEVIDAVTKINNDYKQYKTSLKKVNNPNAADQIARYLLNLA